jgi:hypothetical protein
MDKERLSCKGLSHMMKHGCTTMNLQATLKHEAETHTSSPTIKEFKSLPSASKVLILFWDFNTPILEHYQALGQTVNSAQYCAILEKVLKLAICSKHRGILTNGVVLHHDNT